MTRNAKRVPRHAVPGAACLVAAASLLAAAGPVSAGVTTVSPGDSIQLAILLAAEGDTIEVEPGTYAETLSLENKNLTLRSTGGPDVTFLDVSSLGATPGAVITFTGTSIDSSTVLEGFTLTGGTGNTSLFIEIGGAIFCNESSPTIVDCVFLDNSADLGGAVYGFFGASPALVGCYFEANSSSTHGGAVGAQTGSTIEVVNCEFVENDAVSDAGALFLSQCLPLVVNCTFDGNMAGNNGGAVCNLESEDAFFVNCTFHGNMAGGSGGAVWDDDGMFTSTSTVINSILWANSPNQASGTSSAPDVTYSDVQGGLAGTGNINDDPMFVDAVGGDFRLQDGSPCIDAGNQADLPADTQDLDQDMDTMEALPLDIDGAPRVYGDDVDMGAHEFTGALALFGTTGGDDFGYAVAGLGDVTGDGVPDFAVGSPGFSNARGRVRAYSGAPGHAVLWTRQGPANGDMFGFAIAATGDLNGDGREDLIVGVPGSDVAGVDSGRVFVYSGANGAQLFQRKGKDPGDNFGYAVSGHTDVNNDGKDDIIVGVPNSNLFGAGAGYVDVLSGSNFAVLARRTGGAHPGDHVGWAVAGIGEADGTPGEEFVVSGPFNDQNGIDAGKIVVFRGGATITAIYAAVGQLPGDQFGYALTALGDLDGDGLADYGVGAPDFGGADAGRVYGYKGNERTRLWIRSGPAGSRFGETLASAGDLDCDGVEDVLGGAPLHDANGIDSGLVRILSGVDGLPITAYAGEAGDEFGRGVAALGDTNGDGRAEYLIGAPAAGGSGEGSVTFHASDSACP